MNIKDLKEWLSELPLDEHQLVYREISTLNDDYWAAKDIPLTTSGIDEENKECYFCNEKSYLTMVKHDENKKK